MFQYNCCFGGIDIWGYFYNPLEFQYNCCFGGMFPAAAKPFINNPFQYNCCFGGIGRAQQRHSWKFYVSIQLLFRWNITRYVENSKFRKLFQYNCCFGGILVICTDNIINRLFQYNCCFGGI